MVTSDSGRSLERSLRDARLDDPIERDRALAATEAALFGRPAAPLRFGRYLLLDRIGAGGQGVVHAAYDPELDRRVAIKLLGTRGSSARHADLLREAQAAAKLAHPNVLAIHDVGVFEQRPFGAADTPDHGVYVVSELVDGETFDVWRARGAPSTDAIIEVMCAVGRGLAAAHACGLVHADVKPTNVLIDREGRPRVLDFGVARAIGSSGPRPDEPRPVAGTPAYMAPEQQRGGEDIDARADVFAACVMLYEALFGRRPFDGADGAALLSAKLRGAIDFPRTPRVPRWIVRVLQRGLASDRKDRHPSMLALVEALERRHARKVRVAVGIAVTVATVLTLATVALAQQRARAAQCTERGLALEGVWDARNSEELHAAFVASASPESAVLHEQTFRRVADGLDSYARELTALRERVCRETLIDQHVPLGQMNARMLCLDRRATRLGTLVRRLLEVDGRSAARATQIVAELPPLAPCMDAPVESDDSARGELLALEAELADVDALRHTDRFAEAEAASDRALAAAQSHPAWHARALAQRSQLERWRGDFAAAEAALEQALGLAERAGDDATAAAILIEQGFVIGVPGARHDEGLRALDLAEAKLARIGGDPSLAIQHGYHRGRVLEDAGRLDEAEGVLVDTLSTAEATYGHTHPLIADVANMIGVIAERRGDWSGARERYREAHAMRVELVGELNARTAVTQSNLMHISWVLGDTSGVIEGYREAIAVLARTLGPTHLDTAWARALLAGALLDLERPAEALAEAETGLRGLEPTFAPDHPDVIEAVSAVAGALHGLGRDPEALVLADRVVAATRARHDVGELATVLLDRAEYLRALGRCTELVSVLEEVLALGPPTPATMVRVHRLRGGCALDEGEALIAAFELTHALAGARAWNGPVMVVLAVQYELARALAVHSPTAACEVAAEAIAVIDRTGARRSWRAELSALCSELRAP